MTTDAVDRAVADPRFAVAAARRILFREGCDSQVAGHVSRRSDDGQGFFVTVFEYLDETLPSSVLKVGFDLTVLEGDGVASPAIEFHSAIYQARPDVGAVIHHHAHHTSVFSTLDRPLGRYNAASSLFLDGQALFVDDTAEGDVVAGKRMAAALGDARLMWMKNHGCVVAEESLEAATVLAVMAEKCARIELEAIAVGGTEISEEEARLLQVGFRGNFVPPMWRSLLHRLCRSDPDLTALADTLGKEEAP